MEQKAFNYFLPLSKVEKTGEGHRMVSGYASTPALDMDGEIISIDAMKAALPGYMEWRNIRQMHQPIAVGVAKEASVDDVGLYLRGKIVDANAIKLLDEGVLKGFSIGGKKLSKKGNVITDIELVEISLVDRPANPECRIDAVKSASGKLELFAERPEPPAADETEVSWLRKTVRDVLGALAPQTHPARKPLTFREDVGHEDDTAELLAKAAKERERQAETNAATFTEVAEIDQDYIDMLKAAPGLFGTVVGAVGPEQVPLLVEFAKSPDSILYLEPEARERLAKSIMVVTDMAYAFDCIRRSQRRLIAEGAVEKDGEDKALAKKLGEIASELATVMAQKAEHEGAEATSLTDADDIQSWELQGAATKMTQTNDLNKRAADAIKAAAGKASGHIVKAGKSNAQTMECMKSLGKMFGEHAQKCAEFAKAGGKDKEKPEFDAKKAAGLVKAAFDHAGESGDHMEMANVAMARLANGTVTGDHGVSAVSPCTMTEGSVPWYDAAKPYAGKAASVADDDGAADDQPGTAVAKTFTQAEVDALVKTGKLEAENAALKEALSKTPGTPFKAKTVIAPVGDEDDMSLLMKGVKPLDANDPDARREAAGTMIGNMIANGGRFAKSVFDPSFRGQAGVKRQNS